ncbi:nitrogenase stabilizing/protective protein NifW [Consotaella salsifontis]|uniref:Nitrogenase-stabilizing/protective protein NifW n=1 Tax=Consotaella salsifontis TaxID=1365950 RepID=A0A1T4S8U4_9HYPH|nr:nitrogenase stabilizing/protective protein NifW [Consotaella salsifontis]SKA24720.1 nitrogenase-stabilizing/protective protein [Consotaella salsifontis]
MHRSAARSVLREIKALSSAEDFFLYFLLPYDQHVINVARLHVMRRMGQYLAAADFAGLSEDEIFLEGRRLLKRAYRDFIDSSPGEQRLFKVFTSEGPRGRALVSLDDIAFSSKR